MRNAEGAPEEQSDRAPTDDVTTGKGRRRAPIQEPSGEATPPGSVFALLMSIIWRLPPSLRLPASISVVLVAGLVSMWAILPTGRTLGELVTGRGSSLFPAVEHDRAEYRINLNESGGANWNLDFTFRRMREEATVLADMIATSGDTPQARSNTHELKLVKVFEKSKKLANFDRYVVMLDISKDPIDVERPANITYFTPGGFTGQNTEFAGVLVLQPTRKIMVKIVFQSRKMGSDFRFTTYSRSAPDNKTDVANAKYSVVQQENAVVWDIQNPFLNHVYRVDWKW
jgi:hypothetical protein